MKFLLPLLLLASTQAIAGTYDGAWFFIKGEYTLKSGEIVTADNHTVVAIKTVKGDKFALTNMREGVFNGYLAGEFKTERDTYSEIITAGSSDEHQGKTFTFKGWLETSKVDGVESIYWHHQGMVNGVLETEVWRKIKP